MDFEMVWRVRRHAKQPSNSKSDFRRWDCHLNQIVCYVRLSPKSDCHPNQIVVDWIVVDGIISKSDYSRWDCHPNQIVGKTDCLPNQIVEIRLSGQPTKLHLE